MFTKLHYVTKLLIKESFLFFHDGRKHKIDDSVEKALNVMSTNEKDHMGKVFPAAYYLVKSNQAFKKFPLLIELEELEGIKFIESYETINLSVKSLLIL